MPPPPRGGREVPCGVGPNMISSQIGAGAIMAIGRPVRQSKSTFGDSLNTFKGVRDAILLTPAGLIRSWCRTFVLSLAFLTA